MRQEHDDEKEKWHKQKEELEARVVCLEHKVSTSQVSSDRELAKMSSRYDELEQCLEQRQQELTNIIDDLKTQLKVVYKYSLNTPVICAI